MRSSLGTLLAGLTAALVACGPSTTTPPPATGTLRGTVVLVGNDTYDFNQELTAPADPVAGASFVRQSGSAAAPTDAFSDLRERCFDTSGPSPLLTALKLPLPAGTAVDAGANVTLKAGNSQSYGQLVRTTPGQYSPASPLPQAVPSSLIVDVPGATDGFPAASASVSALSVSGGPGAQTLHASGFSVSTPPTGSQADLDGDIARTWTPGPVAAAGSSSVVIMEFAGVTRRSDRVTCLANDDGTFVFSASDPAYQKLALTNSRVRFESSARAVAKVSAIGSNAFLTTILVSRTVAVPPVGASQ